MTGLYDVTEALLHRFNSYLERIKVHLEPSTPPTPLLMRIFVDTLVQVLTTLAIVTKYCNAIENQHALQKVARAAFRRTSEFQM